MLVCRRHKEGMLAIYESLKEFLWAKQREEKAEAMLPELTTSRTFDCSILNQFYRTLNSMHGLICTSTLSWSYALYVKPFYVLCGFVDPLSPLA